MLSLTGVRQNAVKKFHFWKKKNQNTQISTFCLLLYARLLIEPMGLSKGERKVFSQLLLNGLRPFSQSVSCFYFSVVFLLTPTTAASAVSVHLYTVCD